MIAIESNHTSATSLLSSLESTISDTEEKSTASFNPSSSDPNTALRLFFGIWNQKPNECEILKYLMSRSASVWCKLDNWMLLRRFEKFCLEWIPSEASLLENLCVCCDLKARSFWNSPWMGFCVLSFSSSLGGRFWSGVILISFTRISIYPDHFVIYCIYS